MTDILERTEQNDIDPGPDPVVRPVDPAPARHRLRAVGRYAGTTIAVALTWFALVAPDRPQLMTPAAFVRLPIEGLILCALVVLLPPRWSRVTALVAGGVLAVLSVLRLLDLGFYSALDRPFNPLSDWSYFGPALGVLRDSVGGRWAVVVAIGLGLLLVGVLAGTPLAFVQLHGIARRHRTTTLRAAGALGGVWLLLAGLGLHITPGTPLASSNAAGFGYGEVQRVHAAIQDRAAFDAALAGPDRFRDLPTASLLSGLRGKDVIVAFVESYGRVAVQDSSVAPGVDAVLRSGTAELAQHGFAARSAFLTSPTFGGISWLAHSTLQSGLWVDSQDRYDQLVDTQRFTLSDAFRQAGWRTVADVPSNRGDWPTGRTFYGYEQLYDRTNLGYLGPAFSYAAMPDQYILSAFNRVELAPADRRPVMAEIDLVSSHVPWAPLPRLVPWDSIGDGSIYGPMPAQGQSPAVVWQSDSAVRAAYGESVQYSIQSLISFVENAADPNLVLVLLGDHQPSTVVTGWNATHDVPISVVAADPRVLDRISSWRWQDGLLPGPQAPVWPMDAFRDRFLDAYSDPNSDPNSGTASGTGGG
ncbi:MAG: hypothetical protein QOH89_3233 [Pseudonocardiales bacterium]|nr:hypothetical protein [Pseudonocardiales bacterium]